MVWNEHGKLAHAMAEPVRYESVAAEVEAQCARGGFDLVHPFRVAWYNDAVDEQYWLEDYGREAALGLLIGNTRALWPIFSAVVNADEDHPLDRYTERVIGPIVEGLDARSEVRYAAMSEPRRVAMQRLADATGFAYLSPTHLNVHPVYGPWFGMRAAISVDIDGPDGPPRKPRAPCDCTHGCIDAFRAAPDGSWTAWLAVRDACPVGAEYRYCTDQLRYHYTKNRDILRRQ
jgi:methylmalonic aciduria homocystinuria type C protein